MTAKLSADYRELTRAVLVPLSLPIFKPLIVANKQFTIFQTRLLVARGRKAVFAGSIEVLKGAVLAKILWIHTYDLVVAAKERFYL
jgi:hypothetical protein